MNERIAALYNQAIVIKDGGDYVTGELDPVKFAELIIEECVDYAFANGDNVDYLKQHFGVE